MNLFVIIVTYNGMPWIDRCISSIHNSTIRARTIVVDNNSSDNTPLYIKDKYPEVILIESSENLGFAKANNIGFELALDHKCDFVYLLNQDAWVEANTFEVLTKLALANPSFGIISPLQVNASFDKIDRQFYEYICDSTYFSDLVFNRLANTYEASFINAAHWLLTKECLTEVGGFSPTFPHYGEDNNYIERAKYCNYKVVFTPLSRCVHDREFRKNNKKKEAYLTYIRFLIESSNPNSNQTYIYCSIIFYLRIAIFILRKNFHVLKYIGYPISKYANIVKNRKKTKKKNSPFLKPRSS